MPLIVCLPKQNTSAFLEIVFDIMIFPEFHKSFLLSHKILLFLLHVFASVKMFFKLCVALCVLVAYPTEIPRFSFMLNE